MTFEEIKQLDQQYVAGTYGRADVAIARGKGATCYDFDGKEYIDFGSGIGVNCLGFGDGQWAESVARQAAKLQHTSNLYYTEPCVLVASQLCQRAGMKKAFFCNSGAEANEGAIKAARKYSADKYGPGRYEIITLVNSFHGRTVTTLAATGQEHFHQYFFPFTEGFAYAQAGDIEDVKAKTTDKTCAVMLELIQGEGGVIPVDRDFVRQVAQFCREKDLLLIVDEVQTGVGRTGSLFCYQQYGIHPDLVSCAKGLAGGLPFGAVLFGEKTENVLGKGQHATTFGGNPVASAGSLVVLERLDGSFLNEVKRKGDYIRQRLEKCPNVASVTGLGLMVGVALKKGIGGDQVGRCIEKGVIVLSAKEKIRLLPPLVITYEELDKGLSILEEVIETAQ